MKEKTAVEWFYNKLVKGKLTGKDTIEFLYEVAKEMEKEQIIGSYLQGRMEGHNLPMSMDYVNLLDGAEGEALKHYKETYEN